MKRAVALLAVVLGAGACDEPNNHLLEGQEYDPQAACLGPAEVIDDLPGSDPGDNCSPTCIIATGEDQTAVFITTTCPPFPGYASETPDAASGQSDPCKGAFAVYANVDAGQCTGLEGGTDAASDAMADAMADATTDAETGADAGSDAGADATRDATVPAEASMEAATESGTDAPPGD